MGNSKKYDISDRRAGYQRQEDEPAYYTCAICGARVILKSGEFIHEGDCINADALVRYMNSY